MSTTGRLLSSNEGPTYGRYLAENTVSKDDPILKNLYEIDFDLGEYND